MNEGGRHGLNGLEPFKLLLSAPPPTHTLSEEKKARIEMAWNHLNL